MDIKRSYKVADGVALVAGSPVPKNRIVKLTDAEALYEMAVGRIVPKAAKQTPPAEPVAMTDD